MDGHKRRVYIYDYLNNVDKVWEPLKHWSLNNLDISSVLVLYRNRSIHLASLENNLTDNRVLSLSNVFVVGLEQENSCFHLFEKHYYEAVTKQYKAKQDYELLPSLARKWCSLLDEVISSNVKFQKSRLRTMARNFADEADELHENNNGNEEGDDEDKEDSLQLCTELIERMVPIFGSWSDNWVLENTFKQQHIAPFLLNIFPPTINIRDGESHIVDDPQSLLADYVGSYSSSAGKVFDILAIEVKPPKKVSSAQLQSDFVKTGKEMKDMLDTLVDNGIHDAIVAGFVIEGYESRSYTMELVGEGVYLMVQRGKCELLRSPNDASRIPQLYEHFLQTRNLLLSTIHKIDNIPTITHAIHQAWKRPSAPTPQRTNKKKETH